MEYWLTSTARRISGSFPPVHEKRGVATQVVTA
jgi:hypothetical protein